MGNRERGTWTALFVVLGVAARALRFRGDAPLWGDEAAVALNLLDRGFRALAAPLDLGQVAPLGFLWIERALLLWLGPAERALRLPAFVAGTASVFCLWWLARLVSHLSATPGERPDGATSPRGAAAVLPLAIFAVSYYPIRYSAELKPYAFDLLAACLLQALAVRWLLSPRPRSARPLLALATLAFLAPWLSYPSVLVGAGIAVALAPAVLGDRSRSTLAAYLTFVALLVAGFAGSYLLVGRAQALALDGSGAWLARFWSDSFPPGAPFALLAWLARTHAGMMFAYPNGGPNGGSILTLLLFLAGIATLARRRPPAAPAADARPAVLGVLIAPFAIAFLAACLRLYPYGGSPRISLHLAPSICVLAGVGASAATAGLAAAPARRRALRVLLSILLAVGAVTIARDARAPQGMRGAVTEGRRLATAAAADADVCVVGLNVPADLLIPDQGPNGPQVSFRFNLRRAAGGRWTERGSTASCRRLRAVLLVDGGRFEPAARVQRWEAGIRAALAHAGARGLRLVGERVECTTAACQEKVYVRDYRLGGGAPPSAGATRAGGG